VCSLYALGPLEERGILFVSPGTKVYPGMIIGEHSRDNDLEVNPTKTKPVSNVRTTSKDEKIQLSPPRLLTLEESIALIQDDELLEVTPLSTRLRKIELDPSMRRRQQRAEKN
jgi:GTP-binding protein